MSKTFYFFSYLVILSAIVVMSVVGFWLFYPYKTTEFRDKIIKVENDTVKAGEEISYSVSYCKYTDVTPEISKTFVDGIIYVAPGAVSTTKKGCGVNKIHVTVPKNLPPGVYHLELSYRYKVNPVRTIIINTQTEKFTVIK